MEIWMFPKNRGTPKWMFLFMENPIKMDDLGKKPYFRKQPNEQNSQMSAIKRLATILDADPSLFMEKKFVWHHLKQHFCQGLVRCFLNKLYPPPHFSLRKNTQSFEVGEKHNSNLLKFPPLWTWLDLHGFAMLHPEFLVCCLENHILIYIYI